MASRGLTNVVAAFLRDHIRNADDLHLLVAMAGDEQRWWDETTVASELFMSRSRARSTLEHLAAHNLLEIRVTGDVRYQFAPGISELRDAAITTVAAYRQNPAAVLHAIAAPQPRRGVRAFAEAFRIRRHDDR